MIRAWARPAIFGAFDGITCCIGVILSLAHEPRLILSAAAGVAAAESYAILAAVAAVVWLVQLVTPGGGS